MSYFEENNKFLSFKGVINRRNFIIFYLILMLISCIIYQTPLFYTILLNPDTIQIFSSGVFPLWYSVLILFVGISVGILFLPAVVRRIRDILGEENDNKIYMLAIICFSLGIISLTPVGRQYGIGLIDFVIDIILMCTKGKITGEKPKNDIIKFNWGAFFGTWFWGLWNRIYKTLWMIPLLFTPLGWFIFMLICGFKGNEWVYEKNKEKYNSSEQFHSQQSSQAIVFAVLTPIFWLICFIALAIVTGTAVSKYSQKHPEFATKISASLLKYQQKATKANFDKIEMNDEEYKFYINPESWNILSESGKALFFENAINYSLIENNKYLNPKTTIIDEINITKKVKIISTFNNEILTEFTPTQDEEKQLINYANNKEYKPFLRLKKQCVKINTKPSLP